MCGSIQDENAYKDVQLFVVAVVVVGLRSSPPLESPSRRRWTKLVAAAGLSSSSPSDSGRRRRSSSDTLVAMVYENPQSSPPSSEGERRSKGRGNEGERRSARVWPSSIFSTDYRRILNLSVKILMSDGFSTKQFLSNISDGLATDIIPTEYILSVFRRQKIPSVSYRRISDGYFTVGFNPSVLRR